MGPAKNTQTRLCPPRRGALPEFSKRLHPFIFPSAFLALLLTCSDLLAKSQRVNPSESFFRLGKACQAKGDLDRAIEDFSRAVLISSDFADAYFNRGRVFQRKGDLDASVSDLNRAAEIHPADPLNYLRCGFVRLRQGRDAEAHKDFEKSLSLGRHLKGFLEACTKAILLQRQALMP